MTINMDRQVVIHWLIEQFPQAFSLKSVSVRPLKLGILEDVFEFYSRLEIPPFSKKRIREALNFYTSSRAYLACQKDQAIRLDLFGNPCGHVDANQALYAQQRYEQRYGKERATIK